MIEIKFACPGCGQHLLATGDYSGTQFDCPVCRQPMLVPGADADWYGQIATARAVSGATRSQRHWLIAGSIAAFVGVISLGVVLLAGLRSSSQGRPADGAATQQTPAPSPQSKALEPKALTAAEILQKAAAQYRSFNSYKASGSAVSAVEMSDAGRQTPPGQPVLGAPARTEIEFSIMLARPDLYRVTWQSKAGPASLKGAAWSASEGDCLSITGGKYTKMASRALALNSAAGASGGASATLPAIFFQEPASLLNLLKNVGRGRDEPVEGEDCYVLQGEAMRMRLTLWITKDAFLLRQKQMEFGGQAAMPNLNEDQMEAALNRMDQLTPAQKAQAKAAMKKMKPLLATTRGTTTETYRNIQVNPAVTPEKFNYALESGALPSKTLQ